MKLKSRQLGKKLMSIITTLSLCAAMFIMPGSLSRNVQAGTLVNIVTGKWAAIGLEYFERGAMRALGAAATHAENETVSTILTKTKRLIGNPQSNLLGDIKQLCVQMNAKLDALNTTINENNKYVSKKLEELAKQISKNEYNNCMDAIMDIEGDSQFVTGKFSALLGAVDALDANNPKSVKDLQLAYADLYDIYESNHNPDFIGKKFNFTNDAEKLASLLSTYSYSNPIDYSIDPADKGKYDSDEESYQYWGGVKGGQTVIENYYDILKLACAFDHEMTSCMTAQYNYLSGVAGRFIEAYTLYVSYYAQLVYSQTSDDPEVERNKQKDLDLVWKEYDRCVYMIMRALAQMVDLHNDRLQGSMREYDLNNLVYFNGVKDKINAISVMNSVDDRNCKFYYNYNSSRNKTGTPMQVYMVRPYNSQTTYILRKSNSSQQTIKMDDLDYLAAKEDMWWGSCQMNGYTCDYYNLTMVSASSPTGISIANEGSKVRPLYCTSAFESANRDLRTYLTTHGATDIPNMGAANPWILTNICTWDPSVSMFGNHDVDMKFLTIPQYLTQDTVLGYSEFDMEDDDKKINGKDVTVMYLGEPIVSFYTPNNSGASYQYSSASGSSIVGGRNVLKSGDVVTVRIKPDAGKYIESLKLIDKHAQDEKKSNTVLYTYISGADNLYSSDCGIYPDADGYYTFNINVPFRDAKIEASYADAPTKSHKVTLEESETIPAFAAYDLYYDHDGGILLFDNFSNDSEQKFDTGAEVSVAVIPYKGYSCTGVVVTDANGNEISTSVVPDDDYLRLGDAQVNYRFTMPDSDVTVKAVYGEAKYVTLIQPENGKAHLYFEKVSGIADSKTQMRSYSPDSLVKIQITTENNYTVTNVNVINETTGKAIDCILEKDLISFTMPSDNVTVTAQCAPVSADSHFVTVDADSTERIVLTDSAGTPLNVTSFKAEPGTTVYFKVPENVPEDAVKAYDQEHSSVSVNKEASGLYSIVMSDSDITLDVLIFTVSIDQESYDLSLRFTDAAGNVMDGVTYLEMVYNETVYLKDDFSFAHKISAYGKDDREITVSSQSANSFTLAVPESNVTVVLRPTIHVVEEDFGAQDYNILIWNEADPEYKYSCIDAYDGQKVYIQSDPKIASDGNSLAVRDSRGRNVSLTDEGNNLYSFNVYDYTVVSVPHYTYYTMTIGTVEGGTGTFATDSNVTSKQVEMNGWTRVYLTSPEGARLSNYSSVYTSNGSRASAGLQAISVEETPQGTVTTVSCQMLNRDTTFNFVLEKGYTAYVDKNSFIYDENKNPVAYIEAKNYNTDPDSYTTEPISCPSIYNSLEGRFVYTEDYYPTHIKAVGKTTGTVFKEYDIEETAQTYFCFYPDGFREDVVIVPTFAERNPVVKANVSLDTSKFVYDSEGNAVSYLAFEDQFSAESVTLEKDQTVNILCVTDSDHYIGSVKAVGKNTGTEEELSVSGGILTYQAKDEDVVIVPEFKEIELVDITIDTGSFLTNDKGETVACGNIYDETNKEYSEGTVKASAYRTSFYGKIICDDAHYPVSVTTSGKTSGQVINETQLGENADEYTVILDKAVSEYGEDLLVSFTFGEKDTSSKVTLSFDTDKFIYNDDGKATSCLTWDDETCLPITVESGSNVDILFKQDIKHKLTSVTAVGLTSGTRSEMDLSFGYIPYTAADESVRFVPEFEELPGYVVSIDKQSVHMGLFFATPNGEPFEDEAALCSAGSKEYFGVSFPFEYEISAVTASGNKVELEKVSDNLYCLTVPEEDTVISLSAESYTVEMDANAQSYDLILTSYTGKEYGSYMKAYKGETVMLKTDPKIAEDGSTIEVRDDKGNLLELTDEGENLCSFTVNSYTLISVPSNEKHTMTIGTVEGGTATFERDKDITEKQVALNGWENIYIYAPSGYILSEYGAVNTATGKISKAAVQYVGTERTDNGSIIVVRCQMLDQDLTENFLLVEGKTASVDKDSFVYDRNNNPAAYIEIKDDLSETGYTTDPVIMTDGFNSVEGRFCCDNYHYPTHIKVVGAETGTVFVDEDVAQDATTFNCYTPDLAPYGESIILIPSFGEYERPTVSDVHISTYADLVAFAQNVINDYDSYGTATAILDNNIIITPDDPVWTQGIGSQSENKPFNGTFDGNGFAIVSLIVNNPGNGALFDYIGSSGTVKDLAVIDCDFMVRSAAAGGIAAVNDGLIDHCVSGINTQSQKLIETKYGQSRSIISFNSAVNGTVSGGIAGTNNGTIKGSRSSAFVIGENCAGIAGINNGTIYGCANNGPVGKDSTSNKFSAGIAVVNNGTIGSCYNSGKLTGSGGTKFASVAIENNSENVSNVFYHNAEDVDPFCESSYDMSSACKALDISYMITKAFAEEMNSVTDDSVKWAHVEYNGVMMNQGFPIVRGRFIENVTVVNDAKLKIKAAIINAMIINHDPIDILSPTYNILRSAAGGRTMTCAYDLSAADPAGNYIPAELWCEGITVSIPVATDDAQIVTLNENGEAITITPDSIENGWATFTLTEPAPFAAAENISSDDPEPVTPGSDDVKTGDSSLPVTAACAGMLVSVLAVLATRRKKDCE